MLDASSACRFAPGRTVLRREVLHGRPWMEQPVTVVSDEAGCLAVLLEPGSPFRFFDHPFGPHPWRGHRAWTGSSVLQVQRDGEAHAAWRFLGPDAGTPHWYVNFQAPVVRHVRAGAFETADLGIDIVCAPDDRSGEWKDVDDPDRMVASGRITAAERDRIRVEAAVVAGRLDAGERWWAPWDDWTPGG